LDEYLAGDLERAQCSPLQDFAKEVVEQLFATSADPVLLHGDLHHFNILKHGSDWVVIDPKGLTGDPAYEPCAFMRNPVRTSIDKPTLRARVIKFSEALGYPIERVWGWSFVQTYACGISNEPGNMSEKWSTTSQALYELRTEFWNPDLLRIR
jgi:streptomycin 6-kinase